MTEAQLVARAKELFSNRIGDDAAVIDGQVFTADMLVEDVDFTRATPLRFIARKALAVNLSDLAAMGATPMYALLSLALPSWAVEHADELLTSFAEAAKQHAIEIVGGDFSRAEKLTIAITAIGRVVTRPLLRSGAKAGDRVYVSRPIGGSATGLALLDVIPSWGTAPRAGDETMTPHPPSAPSPLAEGRRALEGSVSRAPFSPQGEKVPKADEGRGIRSVSEGPVRVGREASASQPRPAGFLAHARNDIGYAEREFVESAIRRQLDPEPEVILGIALAKIAEVTACIDVSDGLSTDLHHLCDASQCGAEIERERIPIFPDLLAHGPKLGIRVSDVVLHGGEEYALLFTSSLRESEMSRLLGRPVYAIGRITKERGVVLKEDGVARPLEPRGYDHFEPLI